MNRLKDLNGHYLGHTTTIEATYQIARMAIELGVTGDFVECGVYAGAQSAAMARAIWDTSELDDFASVGVLKAGHRRVHLFDSFQGFPAFSEHDANMAAGGWKAGDSAVSLADVQRNMKRWGIPGELLVYHEGWFEETMPGWVAPINNAPLPSIAVLRLDADLYESTRTAMQHLYPLVSPGGWVIIDDWNLDGCRKAVSEFVTPAPVYFRKDA